MQKQRAQEVCTLGINGFYLLMHYLQPVLPDLVAQSGQFLNAKQPMIWSQAIEPLLAHQINPYQPLLQRISLEQIKPFLSDE